MENIPLPVVERSDFTILLDVTVKVTMEKTNVTKVYTCTLVFRNDETDEDSMSLYESLKRYSHGQYPDVSSSVAKIVGLRVLHERCDLEGGFSLYEKPTWLFGALETKNYWVIGAFSLGVQLVDAGGEDWNSTSSSSSSSSPPLPSESSSVAIKDQATIALIE